ncbi:periplasmic nitrate reductase electron transfer subunit [Oleispira antarctica]|uniref:Periplasmic nitrate reductase, electron transfer subunit n=1 Tax=Oleispira antarctica TaxID=188908 RepID=A0A1Y5HUQ1_OLEAN|nr:periplasmic nitrate reductase electron transfer subunit [Oleispira antarctica]
MKTLTTLFVTAAIAVSSIILPSMASATDAVIDAEPQVATMRGTTPLNEEAIPNPMEKVENNDLKRQRDYPQQPPTIPHDISKYQLDKNFNKCMDCHSRKLADEAQAPAISVTHYMNREGDFLGEMSPRRYFCTQCHVHQLESKPMVENEFVDVDELIKQSNQRAKK